MLIDDNKSDNFFHERVIRKSNAAKKVIVRESAEEALAYLRNKENNKDDEHPEIILLDINMPGMNGWEFIEEYEKLDKCMQSQMIVVMLTTSENPDDYLQAKKHNILADFKSKPLTVQMLNDIMDKYYNSQLQKTTCS